MASQVDRHERGEQARARGRPASPPARCRIRATARQATARRRFSNTLTRSLGFQLSDSAKFRRIRERKRSRLLRKGREQPDPARAVSVDIWQMPPAARESADLCAGRGSLLRAASFAYACFVCRTPSRAALTRCGCMCRCESSAQHARHCWLFRKARQSSSAPSAARCLKFRRVLPRLRRPQQASAAPRPEMSSHTAGRSARQRMAAPTLSTTTRGRAPGPTLEPTRQPPPRLCRTLLPRQQATQATAAAAAPMGFPILRPWRCLCSRCCRRARLNSLRGWTKRTFQVARFVPQSFRL